MGAVTSEADLRSRGGRGGQAGGGKGVSTGTADRCDSKSQSPPGCWSRVVAAAVLTRNGKKFSMIQFAEIMGSG